MWFTVTVGDAAVWHWTSGDHLPTVAFRSIAGEEFYPSWVFASRSLADDPPRRDAGRLCWLCAIARGEPRIVEVDEWSST